MDNNEAMEILIGFNSWRRGEDEDVIYTPQFSPKLIGQAIDFAIQALGEPETIKPYHEHGNSVASDRTESGQSAEDVLIEIGKQNDTDVIGYSDDHMITIVIKAMHTFASQVCADKEREISLLKKELDRAKEEIERSHMDKIYSIHDLKSELSAANESLTVMVRRNTELEEQNKKYWFMIEHGLGVEDMAPPTYPHP